MNRKKLMIIYRHEQKNRHNEEGFVNAPLLLLIFFSVVLLTFLLFVIYSFPIRDQIENHFFDLRTISKPDTANTENIAVITIDDIDLSLLQDPKRRSRIPIPTIIRISEILHQSQAKAIAMILPHQEYPYNSPEMHPYYQYLLEHKNQFLGIFDYHKKESADYHLPLRLAAIEHQVFGAGIMRTFRREVIRYNPLMSYLGSELSPQLVNALALRYADEEIQSQLSLTNRELKKQHIKAQKLQRNDLDIIELPRVKINYFHERKLLVKPSRKLLSQNYHYDLKDKIVLVGFTSFRERSVNYRDGTLVNTPWNGENNREKQGTPLIYLQGIMLQNLMYDSWLRESHPIVNYGQTLILCLLSFGLWSSSPAIAVICFLFMLTIFFYIHCLLMSYCHILIPMADSIIFSVLGTILGAFWRSQQDNKRRIKKEFKVNSQQQLAEIQGRFFNQFATALFGYNEKIIEILSQYKRRYADTSTLHQSLNKAIISSEELREYLEGIVNFSAVNEARKHTITKSRVNVDQFMQKILNQFESQIKENRICVRVNCAKKHHIYTDVIHIETIIFNLISNAIKYSPPYETVTINVEKISKKTLQISIIDKGPGIPKELQEKIFEKFYRIKNDDVYKIKGNGLGLFLCRFFAEKLQTPITVVSDLNQGSCFSIKIEYSA